MNKRIHRYPHDLWINLWMATRREGAMPLQPRWSHVGEKSAIADMPIKINKLVVKHN
jgi:hypothetical protein